MQQGTQDLGKVGVGNDLRDMSLHCHLVMGDWRSVAAYGALPGERSGHSAVMYDGKVSHLHFLAKFELDNVKP